MKSTAGAEEGMIAVTVIQLPNVNHVMKAAVGLTPSNIMIYLPAELWTCIILAATFVNAGVPLSLEITADSAYPVSEMTASSVMLWLYNGFTMILLFCTQLLPGRSIYKQTHYSRAVKVSRFSSAAIAG